jgi:hypothetical protein
MKKNVLFVVGIMLFALVTDAQVVSNYAGTPQTSGGSTTPVDRLSARFEQPYGIDFDSKGNLWLSDHGSHVIYMINAADNKVYIRTGGYGMSSFKNAASTYARLSRPKGLAVGLNDEVYIADYDNQVIRKLTPFTNISNAQYLSVYAGDYDSTNPNQLIPLSGYRDGAWDQALFNNPTDVAVDAQGNVYVADAGNHCIRKIAAGTRIVSTFAGKGTFTGDNDGNATTQALFNNPTGICVVGQVVYVVDRGNMKIKKVESGQVTTVSSGSPYWTPDDVVYFKNMLLSTDQHRIIRDSASNKIVYAGSSLLNDYGYMDGAGSTARFHDVKAIIAKDNSLYVSDMNNFVVRRINTIDCSGYKPTISNNGYILIASAGVSYQWYKDGSSITGATMQQHNAATTGSGDYTVMVTNSDGCTAMSDPFNVFVSVFPGQTMKSIVSLYPNPGNGLINLKLETTGVKDMHVVVSDVLGKTVYDATIDAMNNANYTIDLSACENALYFISIQSDAGKHSIRYIKE